MRSKILFRNIAAIITRNASWAFKLGLLLLLINPVIGLAISPLLVFVFSYLFNVKTGVLIGSGVYIFSWGLLGLGVLLSGKEGYRISKQVYLEIRKYVKDRKGYQ